MGFLKELIKNLFTKPPQQSIHFEYSIEKNDKKKSFPKDEIEELIPSEVLKYTKTKKLVKDFVVLDLETTGLSHVENEIIQVGAVRYVDFTETEIFSTYIMPVNSIPSQITEITGITNRDVKNAPNANMVINELLDFIKDDVIIAHNAQFDMKFLLATMYKENVEYRKFKVIDTLPLSEIHISTKNHKLPTLKGYLNFNHFDSHEALHDCFVTAELYKYCYEKSIKQKEALHR